MDIKRTGPHTAQIDLSPDEVMQLNQADESLSCTATTVGVAFGIGVNAALESYRVGTPLTPFDLIGSEVTPRLICGKPEHADDGDYSLVALDAINRGIREVNMLSPVVRGLALLGLEHQIANSKGAEQ